MISLMNDLARGLLMMYFMLLYTWHALVVGLLVQGWISAIQEINKEQKRFAQGQESLGLIN